MSITTFTRVDQETLEVTLMYNTNGGPKWAPDDLECPIPFDIVSNVAVRDETTGEITLVPDPAKVEAKRQAQIATNKAHRDLCLKMTDFTMLPDTGLENVQEWVAFRASLRSLDLSPPVTWPQEPQSPWGPFLPPAPV